MTTQLSDIDMSKILTKLEGFCKECDYNNTADCKEAHCLIGYGKKVTRFALKQGVLEIPGAHQLIPKKDFKHYYQEAVAGALAETCTQCRECRENHSADCVISLVRNALESAVLQEQLEYPGSVFMYLAQVKEQNPELATALAKEISGQK